MSSMWGPAPSLWYLSYEFMRQVSAGFWVTFRFSPDSVKRVAGQAALTLAELTASTVVITASSLRIPRISGRAPDFSARDRF